MATKIYVGGLADPTTEEALRTHFEQHGTVESVDIILDTKTGKSKGIGFVKMPSSEEAQKAISNLNTKDLEGRRLTVNQAKPRAERS